MPGLIAAGCRRLALGLAAALAFTAGSAPATSNPMTRVAVFNFELIDSSLEGEISGPRADERQRLVLISDQLRRQLRESGRYEIVDMSGVAEEIEAIGYVHACNGCQAQIAGPLGATLAISGTVQKVSNLILNINLYLYDVPSGKLLKAMSVDIRSNTDKSWSRGVSYLVRHRILKE